MVDVSRVELESLYTATFLSGEKYWAVFDPDGNFVECVETIGDFRERYGINGE